jgi:hypothetical protein
LNDREKKQTEQTIVISAANIQKAQCLFERVGFVSTYGNFIPHIKNLDCEPYLWLGDEISGTHNACVHLKGLLTQAGVNFDTEFQLKDCHTNNQLLNFSDNKVGKIIGGTDLVITPKGTSDFSLPLEICVVVELKTTNNIKQNGIDAYDPSARVEFVSANCLSHQPSILTVLTDLNSIARAWVSHYDSDMKQVIVVEYLSLSLNEVVALMAEHLNTAVMKNKAFFVQSTSTQVEAQRRLEMKRKFSEGGISDAWAQFEDLAEGTEDWSRDRALATWNLLRNCGIDHMPTVVHHSMYT